MIALLLTLALAQEPVAESAPETTASEATGPERSSPPAVIPAELLELDEPERHELGPGQVAWHVRIPGVRKVEVGVYLFRGTYELDGWPTELAKGTLQYADVATESYDAQELEILTDVHDLDVRTFMSNHLGGARLSAPLEELDLGLELIGEVLQRPSYPKKEVAQGLQDQRLYYLVQGPSSLSDVSWNALSHAWTPADHPYGARPDLAAMKKLKSSELAAKELAWRTSGPIAVLVVGDVAWSAVEPGLKAALAGLATEGERADELDWPAPAEDRVIAVDMPGQAQTALRLRYAAPGRLDADRVAFHPMQWALGGHFLSRLNANLREDKGFTYGAGAGWNTVDRTGYLTVYVDVKAENTGAAIQEIERELERLTVDGVTAEELDMARQDRTSGWNGTRQTASSGLSFYASRLWDEESVADARARYEATAAVTPEQVAEVARKWLKDRPHTWIVVGDRGAIEDQLKGLGLEPEWITPQQAILGSF